MQLRKMDGSWKHSSEEERIDTSASACSYKGNRELHVLHMEHLVQGKDSDLFVYLIRDADLEERKIPPSRRLRA